MPQYDRATDSFSASPLPATPDWARPAAEAVIAASSEAEEFTRALRVVKRALHAVLALPGSHSRDAREDAALAACLVAADQGAFLGPHSPGAWALNGCPGPRPRPMTGTRTGSGSWAWSPGPSPRPRPMTGTRAGSGSWAWSPAQPPFYIRLEEEDSGLDPGALEEASAHALRALAVLADPNVPLTHRISESVASQAANTCLPRLEVELDRRTGAPTGVGFSGTWVRWPDLAKPPREETEEARSRKQATALLERLHAIAVAAVAHGYATGIQPGHRTIYTAVAPHAALAVTVTA